MPQYADLMRAAGARILVATENVVISPALELSRPRKGRIVQRAQQLLECSAFFEIIVRLSQHAVR